MTFTTIRRRGQRRRHLYNGAGGQPERELTLCGMRITRRSAMISQTDDAYQIGCEDCLIAGIRLAARRDELRARREAERN